MGLLNLTQPRRRKNMRKGEPKSAARLAIEVLEDRTAPAVDITAFSTAAGTVVFTGDQNGTTADLLVLSQVTVDGEVRLAHNLIGNGGTGNYADATDIDPSAGVAHLVLGSGTAPLISVNLGAGHDTLRLANSWDALHAISVDGGTGVDALVARNGNNVFTITGATSGTLAPNISFTNMERLDGASGNDTFNINADFSGTIRGGAGNDTFNVGADVTVAGTIVGGTGVDVLDLSDATSSVTVTLTGLSAGFSGTSDAGAFAGIDNIIGGSEDDTLIGLNVATLWNLDATPTMTVLGGTLAFSGFENLQGGTATDLIVIFPDAVDVSINAGAGLDVVFSTNIDAQWVITGAASGTLAGVSFDAVERIDGGIANDTFDIQASFTGAIRGGVGDDRFILHDGVSVGGGISGGVGVDILDLSQLSASATVNLTGVSIAGFSGNVAGVNFSGMNHITASADVEDTLVGPNLNTVWNLDASPTLIVNGITLGFSGFENLQGGTANDTFILSADVAQVSIKGGAGFDVVIGANVDQTWTITGASSGTVGNVEFNAVERLDGGVANDTFNIQASFSGGIRGGAGDDVFVLDDGIVVSGGIVGGTGIDTLDLTDIDSSLTVTLTGVAVTGFVGATVSGSFHGIDNIVADENNNTLVGANFNTVWALDGTPSLTTNGTTLSFTGFANLQGGSANDTFLITANTTVDIHGGAGSDSFVISAGVTLNGAIHGGGGIDVLNLAAFTVDVFVNLLTGVATGVANGVIGIENVIGGSGDDVLIGSSANNVLTGGAGNDILIGNDGGDVLIGGAGRDILIGGRGRDVLLGGADEDLLIGGFTSFDADLDVLASVMAEWSDTSEEFNKRVNNMRKGIEDEVVDDDAVDVLTGGADARDWFIIGDDDVVTDRNQPGGERVTRVR